MNNNVTLVLTNLRQNYEYEVSTDQAGKAWCHVYLDNARPAGMNDKVFRAALAQLAKGGLYKPVDGEAWGCVRLA